MKIRCMILLLIMIVLSACVNRQTKKNENTAVSGQQSKTYPPGTFGYDLEFLADHHKMILLSDSGGTALAAVSPEWQGRVMTSSFDGMEGVSLGWINHELIRSREIKAHINPFGGEDRFWLGPEGGQFALFFKPGKPFDAASWQVPEELDTRPFDLVSHSGSDVNFRKVLKLTNYSGFTLNILVERRIRLLSGPEIRKILQTDPGSIKCVGFESQNRITNTGIDPWTRTTGAVSVWILGMFRANDQTTVVIPLKKTEDPGSGKGWTSYFAAIPPERLMVHDEYILFRGDGKFRCKIGISPERAMPFLGAYDGVTNVLTIVNIDLPAGNDAYVNSLLEIQDHPFSGDVYNSYNDGPSESGERLGSYFELETSSPAAFLEPGKNMIHSHRTIHLTGEPAELNNICLSIFRIPLAGLKEAFRQDQ